MRRRAPTIEQPGLCQSEGSEANGSDPPHGGRCFAQESDCMWRRRHDLAGGADEQRVIRVFLHGRGIHGPAQRVGYPIAALGHEEEIIKSLPRNEVGGLECGNRCKAQHAEVGWQEQSDAKNDDLPIQLRKGRDGLPSDPNSNIIAHQEHKVAWRDCCQAGWRSQARLMAIRPWLESQLF
jgi:hypothetical protein